MAEILALTGEERVLLYLLNFGGLEDDAYECDPGVTQRGVAMNAGIQRKHISRSLEKLLGQGFIQEYTKRVSGAKQKMKCYGLTPQGLQMAMSILERVGLVVVKVRMGGEIRDMRIADIDGATSVNLRLSDILCETMKSDVLDMDVLEGIEERNRRMMDERTHKSDVYREALAIAWRDGILTGSEKHLVDALRSHLGITDQDHRAMEAAAMRCAQESRVESHDEIMSLLAGQPPEFTEKVLELIRGRIGRD